MRKLIGLSLILWLICSGSAFASNEQMNATLVKIIHQLEAIKPLIHQAESEQTQNPRIKVHFDSWADGDGNEHAGLRQDINAIQQALIDAINQHDNGPRVYQPIKDDFIGDDHV